MQMREGFQQSMRVGAGVVWLNLFNQTMALFGKFLWLIIDENEEPGHDHRNIPFRAAVRLLRTKLGSATTRVRKFNEVQSVQGENFQ